MSELPSETVPSDHEVLIVEVPLKRVRAGALLVGATDKDRLVSVGLVLAVDDGVTEPAIKRGAYVLFEPDPASQAKGSDFNIVTQDAVFAVVDMDRGSRAE